MHPERLGPYRVMGLLGRGGLGVVYRALDERTEDEVAVKLLVGTPAQNDRAAQRFIREFQSLADLDHPNVVQAFEAGISDDMPYFAMELVEGLDIRRHVDSWSQGHPDVVDPTTGDRLVMPVSSPRIRPAGGSVVGSAGGSVRSSAGGSAAAQAAATLQSLDESSELGDDASSPFDMNAWLSEPDSDVLLGREVDEPSGIVGATGPAPSVDMPFESVSLEQEPFEMPPRQVAASDLNDPLRLIRVRELLVQTCSALAYIHSRGLVHRDLKPSNILVDVEGDVRIMDFGLCKSLADLSEVTDSGQVVGTYRYMSPEQASGEPLDARSDLYSLGVILYELLAGRPPFTERNPMQLWEALLEREPPPLFALNSAVDPRLAQVTHALLRKDPGTRLQTAEEVLEAILE